MLTTETTRKVGTQKGEMQGKENYSSYYFLMQGQEF